VRLLEIHYGDAARKIRRVKTLRGARPFWWMPQAAQSFRWWLEVGSENGQHAADQKIMRRQRSECSRDLTVRFKNFQRERTELRW